MFGVGANGLDPTWRTVLRRWRRRCIRQRVVWVHRQMSRSRRRTALGFTMNEWAFVLSGQAHWVWRGTVCHISVRNSYCPTPPVGSIRTAVHQRRGGAPPRSLQTKVTIVGTTKIYHWDNCGNTSTQRFRYTNIELILHLMHRLDTVSHALRCWALNLVGPLLVHKRVRPTAPPPPPPLVWNSDDRMACVTGVT